jgi:hypothetical protein
MTVGAGLDCGGRVIHAPSVQRTKSPTAGMAQAYGCFDA